jgi:hypothetical protein
MDSQKSIVKWMLEMTEIEGVAKEILKQLKYYEINVSEKVDKAKEENAKACLKAIKMKRPKGRRNGEYAKGWRIKRTSKRLIIHNATDYQLTHLLEHGHVLRRGGRNIGETDEKPHIRPAEETAVRNFLQDVERAIEQ